jgi:hypothetical protein
MKLIALGPLLSTQSALGDVAEVKDAVGFAEIWIPFRLALDFVQRRYATKADFARSAAALPATSGAMSAIGIVCLHRALVHCKPASLQVRSWPISDIVASAVAIHFRTWTAP